MGSTNAAGPAGSAIFVDLDSLATDGRRTIDVDIACIIKAVDSDAELLLKNAYADWSRFSALRAGFLEAGFLEVQSSGAGTGKEPLDQQLTVDALEAVMDQPDLATVYLVTTDDSFVPLVRALQRRGKKVVGIGWAQKAGGHFSQTCDEFIEYESIAPEELSGMVLRASRGRGGSRRPSRPAQPSESLSMDDPRDSMEGGSAEPGFRDSAPQEAPEARYELDHADRIIGLLVARNGPGYHPPGNRFVAAMTRIDPAFTLEDYGFENVTGFVNAHPMLSRQPERGRHFEIHLPRKVSLKTVMAGAPFSSVEQMMDVLSSPPIGFLGVTKQTDVLEALHAIAMGSSEPFTRNALVDETARKVEGVTRDQVAAVERLLWENKLYESVDRSAEVAEEWAVRLKPVVADIDDLMYLHDRELVFQAMLQGAFLTPEGWSMLFYGDDTSGDEFLEMLSSLGFELDVDTGDASQAPPQEQEKPKAKSRAKSKPKAKPETEAKAESPEPAPEEKPVAKEAPTAEPEAPAPEEASAPEPEAAAPEVGEPSDEPQSGGETDAEEKPPRSFETVVTEATGPKRGGWWNRQ